MKIKIEPTGGFHHGRKQYKIKIGRRILKFDDIYTGRQLPPIFHGEIIGFDSKKEARKFAKKNAKKLKKVM